MAGSTLMFGLPAASGQMALDESVFKCIPLEPLMLYRGAAHFNPPGLPGLRRRQACALKPRRAPAKDIVAAATQLLHDGVLHLAGAVQAGRLSIGVRLARVGREAHAVVEEIRAMKPRTMTWSNVSDYWQEGELVEVLGRCSVGGTEHSLYSMNWIMDVKGACVIDFDDPHARADALRRGKALVAEHYRRRSTDPLDSVPEPEDEDEKGFGAAHVLLCPPPTNPYNVADYYLAHLNQHGICVRWLQHLARAAKARLLPARQDLALPSARGQGSGTTQQGGEGEAGSAIALDGPYVLSNPYTHASGRDAAQHSVQNLSEAAGSRQGWTAFTYTPFHHNHNLLAFSFVARQ